MKNKNTLFIILVIACIAGSCKQKAKETSVPQTDSISIPAPAQKGSIDSNDTISSSQQAQLSGMEMLREFYTLYITENDKKKRDDLRIATIKEKYVTPKLIAKIDSAMLYYNLDYDPFVNAQDYDTAWIKTLEIAPVPERTNTFDICYTYNKNSKSCTTVVLVESEGKYMIDNFDGLDETISALKEKANDDFDFLIDESEWKGLTSTLTREDDGYTTIQEYTFPNATMQQAYALIKRIDGQLKEELPANDLEYSKEDGSMAITYQYQTPKHLHITLNYGGGTSDVDIIEGDNNTHAKIVFSAD